MKDFSNYECEGQMDITEFLDKEDENPVREPCGRRCDVEWCSRTCFERRGNIWDYKKHQWMRNMKGEIIRLNNPECSWEPEGDVWEKNADLDVNGSKGSLTVKQAAEKKQDGIADTTSVHFAERK